MAPTSATEVRLAVSPVAFARMSDRCLTTQPLARYRDGLCGVHFDDMNGTVITTYNNLFDDLPVELAVAPNGTEVAYKYLSQLWIQPLDGSPARQLTEGNIAIEGAAFSPDGQTLAVRRDDGSWCYGTVHLLPNHHGAPINIAADGPTLVRTNEGIPVSACYQLYWLP